MSKRNALNRLKPLIEQFQQDEAAMQVNVQMVKKGAEECKDFLAEGIYDLYTDELGTLSDEGRALHTEVSRMWSQLDSMHVLFESLTSTDGGLSDSSHLIACVEHIKNSGLTMPWSVTRAVFKKACKHHIAVEEYSLAAETLFG